MIFEIGNSEELLAKMKEINDWIEANQSSIGNANMFEIMACMLARNNIRVLEGKNDLLDAEVERMISLRGESIAEFQADVPESRELFEAVRGGMTVDDSNDMNLICRSQGISFFINNARRRGFDGDITMPLEVQAQKAIPNFEHDNMAEIRGFISSYEKASDDVKVATYPIVKWTVDNLVPELKNRINLQQPVAESGYGL